MDNKRYYITLVLVITTIIVSVVLLTGSQVEMASGRVDCRFSYIEYTNVSPLVCWYDDIAPDYCPLPHDVQCSIDGTMPINAQLLVALIDVVN